MNLEPKWIQHTNIGHMFLCVRGVRVFPDIDLIAQEINKPCELPTVSEIVCEQCFDCVGGLLVLLPSRPIISWADQPVK